MVGHKLMKNPWPAVLQSYERAMMRAARKMGRRIAGQDCAEYLNLKRFSQLAVARSVPLL